MMKHLHQYSHEPPNTSRLERLTQVLGQAPEEPPDPRDKRNLANDRVNG
jgi:hypothetical protein